MTVASIHKLLFILCLLVLPLTAEAGKTYDEYQLKAAISYKIAKFVTWPEDSFSAAGDPFVICVFADDDVVKGFDSLEGRAIGGRKIQLKTSQSGQTCQDANLFYFSESHIGKFTQNLSEFKDRPILTISDMKSFSSLGGMITLNNRGKNIRLVINLSSAFKARLNISSKLNVLATKVIRDK
jgi:YfiR/HmsC-like